MLGELRALWRASDFARENLSFHQAVGLLLEKHGFDRDALLKGHDIDCPELLDEFSRAVSGEPLGYIIGKASFYNEEYFVEKGVLIPRADSEAVVEAAVRSIPKNTHFTDICTGSGCLGISTLMARPDLTATLLDISPISERVARKNIEALGVHDRCEFKHFDFFSDINSLPECSAVIMNPPYITSSEMKKLPENVKREPTLALEGGEDGLDFYRFAAKSEVLRNKTLIFEIGCNQGDAVKELFQDGVIIKDLGARDRVFLKTAEKE